MSRSGASRRTFLQAGAVGAAGAGLAAVLGRRARARRRPAAAVRWAAPPPATPSAMFGRMFADLPPFADNTASLRSALLDLAAPGGMLDAQDDLFGPDGGPVLLITDPNLSLVNKNNPHDTAGMTFVGQFIDHDLTFDATSRLGVTDRPDDLAQPAHARASTSTRCTAAARSRSPSSTTRRTRSSSCSSPAASSRTCPVAPTTPPSSATRATTPTCSSPACTPRSCASTTRPSTT